MKNSQLISLVIAFVAGAGVVAGMWQMNRDDDDPDLRAQLSAAQDEIRMLKNKRLKAGPQVQASEPKLTSLPSAIPAKTEIVATTEPVVEDQPAQQDPAAAFAKLFNSKEARGLMKQMSAGFAQRGEQWIEQGISEYTEKLNLSDEQVASLKKRLSAQMGEQMEAFNAKLDDEEMSMQEIMEEQRDVMRGQDDVMAEILKEELDEDQFAEFEREQLVEKTERVQRDSDRELTRLDTELELSESQEDQVFGILVQTNSDYDESMAIEGADAAVNVGEDVAKEDAIREVLDEGQTEKYNANLEKQQGRRGNPFGGGFRGFGR